MTDHCPYHVFEKDGLEYRGYSVGSMAWPNSEPIPDWTGLNTVEEIKLGLLLARTTKYTCHVCGREWESPGFKS